MIRLLYPILIPLAAGLVVLVVTPYVRRLGEMVALAGSLAMLYATATVFLHDGTGMYEATLFSTGGFSFILSLRVDTLSMFVLLGIASFVFLIVLYSLGYMGAGTRRGEYYCYLLWTGAGAAAAVLADSLLLLLVAWEVTTALLFLLVTMGGEGSRDAAGKSFVMIGFSDCALLLGIMLVWAKFGTLTMHEINGVSTGTGATTLMYTLFLIPALVKAGAMPGHSWIPKVAETAPASVIAFLPASLDKLLGIYLLARISLEMFVLDSVMKSVIMLIGAVTIVVAVMMALLQHNLRKLLAFHAVSQVGYMVLGIGTGVTVGVVGGLFHMVNHAIYKCCLFLCNGAVEKATGTSELEDLGGLAATMPVTFGACLVSAFAISGVPPLNGFASKWMIYQGTIAYGSPVFLIAAMFGSALTLASFVKVIHSVFLGKKPDLLKQSNSIGFTMKLPMIILALICIAFGVRTALPLSVIGEYAGMESGGFFTSITSPTGMWNPGLAVVMLIISLFAGFVIYLLTGKRKLRRTTIFTGGEEFTSEAIRYPGTGFYESIRSIKPLATIFRDAERGVYDLYVLGGYYGVKFVNVLRAMHNGVVSTYVAFTIIGLGALIFYMIW